MRGRTRLLGSREERDERGAVVVLTALLLPVLLLVCAVVVDLGMLRVARADAQTLADVVALDLARDLDGREISPAYRLAMDAAAERSLERNVSVIGYDDHRPTLDVRLGELDDDGVFSELTAGVPTAVEVVAGTGVDFAFAGITDRASGAAQRSAVAVSDSAACFQLGSWAATIRPGAAPFFEDILGQVLGDSVVRAAGWDGLATSSLALGDIAAAESIEVGTVDGLLAVPGLTAGDWFLAMAEVLQRDGSLAEAEVLEAAAVSAIGDVVVDLGELLALSTATDAALDTRFNALDLLIGTAFLANRTNLLALHNLQAGVPSVGVTDTSFTIIEGPRRACNGDTARTAQARLTSTAKLQLKVPLLKTSLVDLRLTDGSGKPDGEVNLHIDVELAGAHGHLTDYACAPDTFEADVWTDLVKLRMAGTTYIEGDVRAHVLGIGVLDIPVRFGLDVVAHSSRPESLTPDHVGPVTYPPQVYGDPVTAAAGELEMPYVDVARVSGSLETGPVKVLGIPVSTSLLDAAVNPVLDGIMGLIRAEFGLVNPLVDKVNDIVGPLATGFGITTAGADFFGLPRPSCQHPALRG